MKKNAKKLIPILAFTSLIIFQIGADGGYVSKVESVAVSADQRAIIIKNGNEISMTLSTGYTGKGDDFGWIIPTPNPPRIEHVRESGPVVEEVFDALDRLTAPKVKITSGGGCFPAGTDVLTAEGPRAIDTVTPGTMVYAFDLKTEEWKLQSVLQRQSHPFAGDMITIQIGPISVEATGNHPFFVLHGAHLASRPVPQDLPTNESVYAGGGKWVEARDLRVGDVLITRGRQEVSITEVTNRFTITEVYNLNVDNNHNYAVDEIGILVHNKGGAEESSAVKPAVELYGSVMLEHYEVSILGAAAGSDLINWLQEHGYVVSPDAREVLDYYISKNWAFVAVKLNPGKGRRYKNDMLPPLIVKFQSDKLVFPLRISSISTVESAKISIYVIAESTVRSLNYPTDAVTDKRSNKVDIEDYVEFCIHDAAGRDGRKLALLWSGYLGKAGQADKYRSEDLTDVFMIEPDPPDMGYWLTRFEARMGPSAMTQDITFALDSTPIRHETYLTELPDPLVALWGFSVGIKSELALFFRNSQDPGLYETIMLATSVKPARLILPIWDTDFLLSKRLTGTGIDSLIGVEASVNFLFFSVGLSLMWDTAAIESIDYVGVRIRLFDVPPVVAIIDPPIGIGVDWFPMTFRRSRKNGDRLFTIGLMSLGAGLVNRRFAESR